MKGHKVLVISGSQNIRFFLEDLLKQYGFEVISVKDGMNGIIRLKNEKPKPNLVITDFDLPVMSCEDFLKEKEFLRYTHIPVIIFTGKIHKGIVAHIGHMRERHKEIKKVISKPVAIDTLLQSVADVLDTPVKLDPSPSLVDIRYNEGILFIDIEKGLNKNKINVIKYKMKELKGIYGIDFPRLLVSLKNMDFEDEDLGKLDSLVTTILESLTVFYNELFNQPRLAVFFTDNDDIRYFLETNKVIVKENIKVVKELDEAVDYLNGLSLNKFYKGDQDSYFDNKNEAEEVFSVTFETEKGKKTPPGSRTALKAAIVDDDEIIHKYLSTLLKEEGVEIESYYNGNSFAAGLEKSVPDVLFLDIMMPGMNGLEVLEVLDNKQLLDGMTVLILSSHVSKEAVTAAKKYNIKHYVSKENYNTPLLKGRIHDLIRKVKTGGKNLTFEFPDRPVRAVLVDDDYSITEYMKLVFSKFNVEGYFFQNGKEFVDKVKEIKPDLIYLDLMMPVMTGIEVIAWMKEHKIDIPVIIFSALSKKETINELNSLGIKHFVLKPPTDAQSVIKKGIEVLGRPF